MYLFLGVNIDYLKAIVSFKLCFHSLMGPMMLRMESWEGLNIKKRNTSLSIVTLFLFIRYLCVYVGSAT